jgi:hypothetical protein
MFGMLKTDFSKLKSERIGSGTFGAKTTELDRFKDAAEKAKVIVPPYVSLPFDFFTPALVRNGFLIETGIYTGKAHQRQSGAGNLIEFTQEEKKTIIEAFSRFMDFIVAVRSDELTAKGVGVFSTKFVRVTKKSLEDGTIFNILSDILANQFKRRMNMSHGIGIQIMPLAADGFGGFFESAILYPRTSIAGFTAREKEKAILNVGFGIGGGVSAHAAMKIFEKGKIVSNGQHNAIGVTTYLESRTGTITYTTELIYRFEERARRNIAEVVEKVLKIANITGTDIYFEIQSTPNGWALTQISAHAWPKIEKPQGEEIELPRHPTYFNENWVVGSGIVSCNGVEEIYLEKKLDANLSQKLVITDSREPHNLDSDNFHLYEKAGAIIDFRIHRSLGLFSSHVAGLFREVGIPVLNADFSYAPNHLEQAKLFYVWADELNQKAGIVLP